MNKKVLLLQPLGEKQIIADLTVTNERKKWRDFPSSLTKSVV